MQLPKTIKDWFLPRAVAVDEPPIIQPGLYHFQREVNGEHVRYHLRVDEDGPAILIAAASEALLLSPAGAAVAKGLLEGKDVNRIEGSLPVANPSEVVEDVRHALEDLGQWDVRYPIFNLVDPALYERPWKLSAPLQADVVVGSEAVTRAVIEKLWEARIPHVRFIVTPRSGKDAVIQSVLQAEDIGMIAGVRLRSSKWLDDRTLQSLAQAGVDYLVLPWGVTEALHERWYGSGDHEAFVAAISKIIRSEVTPVADAALVRSTWEHFPTCLDEVVQLGVDHIELFAIAQDVPIASSDLGSSTESDTHGPDKHGPDKLVPVSEGFGAVELRQLAGWIEDLADQRKVQLVWLPPIHCPKNRSHDEIVRQAPRAGGDVTIRVEADGNVIPPRGPKQIVGNLLEQTWESIWEHEVFRHYRDRVDRPTRCDECPDMTVCAARCPADQESWVTL